MKSSAQARVVVADGGTHLVLGNRSHLQVRDLYVRTFHDNELEPASVHWPGRYQTPGGRRTALAAQEPKSDRETAFSVEMANRANRDFSGSRFHDLVVLGDAITMGVPRRHFSANVTKFVRAEMFGDFARQPIEKIESAIRDA